MWWVGTPWGRHNWVHKKLGDTILEPALGATVLELGTKATIHTS